MGDTNIYRRQRSREIPEPVDPDPRRGTPEDQGPQVPQSDVFGLDSDRVHRQGTTEIRDRHGSTTEVRTRPGTTEIRRPRSTDAFSRKEQSSRYHHKPSSARHYAAQLADDSHSRIGGYRLLEKIGEGGMSIVYRALQIASGRVVALKVVRLSEMETSQALIEQIFREAAALAAINHPNVIKCYGFGEDKGRMYMALELLTGGDATGLVRQNGRLSESLIIDLALQCIEGFQAVHNGGFVHRDIKPQNLFIDDNNTVKIADLGLAWTGSPLDHSSRLRTMGTPSFMAPEQVLADRALDFRADIYSLGATLYYFGCGQPPFVGEDVRAVLEQVVHATPPELKARNPDLSDAFVDLLATMMAKHREDRYPSLEALREDLQMLRGGDTPRHAQFISKQTVVIRPPISASSGSGNTLARLAIILGSLLLLAAGIAIFTWLPQHLGEWTWFTDSDPATPTVVEQPAFTPQQLDLFDSNIPWQPHGPVGWIRGQAEVHCAGGHLRLADTTNLLPIAHSSAGFSLEVIITPKDLKQVGPARIVSWSGGASLRNLTLGQQGQRLELRLRTTNTTLNGLRPHLLTEPVLSTEAQHVVVVWQPPMARIFHNGHLIAEERIEGDLSNWEDRFALLIGDEEDGGFPWHGNLTRVVFENQAIDMGEIRERHRSWLK